MRKTEEGLYDFAFVDADKKNYANYFEALLPLIRSGGLIVFDNVLWQGKVVDANVNDEETKGIRKINEILKTDTRVELSMLPIADGVSFVRKL